jgi:hypothetical protein
MMLSLLKSGHFQLQSVLNCPAIDVQVATGIAVTSPDCEPAVDPVRIPFSPTDSAMIFFIHQF